MPRPSYPQGPFVPPPDATELILVRHGASADAVPGEPFELIEGQSNPPLSPDGETQARAVAERLAREPVAALFISTLDRTAQTAAPLAALTGLEPVVLPGLREVHVGELEGGRFRVAFAERDPVFTRLMAEQRWEVIPGAESSAALAARVRAAAEQVAATVGPGRRRGRDHPRRSDRRAVPSGHRKRPVRVPARRQRVDHADRRRGRR